MRPDIRYYDKAEKEVDEVDGEDGMVDEQEAKPKDKSKVLQEIKIEYTKLVLMRITLVHLVMLK